MEQTRRRRTEFRNRGNANARMANLSQSQAERMRRQAELLHENARANPDPKAAENLNRSAARCEANVRRFARYATQHERLKEKYLRAAAHPWDSVEPDPPPPEPI